ncbi:hypothetical protein Dimus_027602 [Dionaea muscipula]
MHGVCKAVFLSDIHGSAFVSALRSGERDACDAISLEHISISIIVGDLCVVFIGPWVLVLRFLLHILSLGGLDWQPRVCRFGVFGCSNFVGDFHLSELIV